jgi:predicted phage tail protein
MVKEAMMSFLLADGLLIADGTFAGGLLLSATLLGFAAWLHFNEKNGWDFEQNSPHRDSTERNSEEDAKYRARRRRSRNKVHFLFAVSGVLVLLAAIAGPSVFFVAAWSCVAFMLMAIMGIAMLDGVRTHIHHRDKLPEIRRKILDADD